MQGTKRTCRSYGAWFVWPVGFYKHVAPTALRLGSRTRQVFQQAAKRLPSHEVTYPRVRRLSPFPA